MNVNCLRTFCVEICRTLNSLNPSFMKKIFSLRQKDRLAPEEYKPNLDIPSYNKVTFVHRALTFIGLKILK